MPRSTPKIKIITRNSPLALAQTREITDSLPGLSYELAAIETIGDKNKKIPLTSPGLPDDFFTRELDDEILRGRADIAVHSAKDVPTILRAGLEIIALTAAADTADALVSVGNRPLSKLKNRAVVGASSAQRKSALLEIRPDLKVVPVRGTIGERLSLVDDGKLDALVVAACALKRLGLASRIAGILPFPTHPLQGMLAVTAGKNRADLKALFGAIDVRTAWGKVYIIGAGPGGADLLTARAANILARADIIYYDDLIDKNIIDSLRCRKIYVGKRKGSHPLPQSRINEMLRGSAMKKRQIVARLKGGDPFIFGRGGEELLYLRERHIDAEVVAGITAASAAAASCGLPLTMRGVSGVLSFLSAHTADDTARPPTAAARSPRAGGTGRNGTLVFYMAASKIAAVKKIATESGFGLDTPAALVHKAGFADEKIILTNLRNIAAPPAAARKSPLTVIVGKTAGLAAPRDKILFTGLDPLACFVPGRLIHYPLIEIIPRAFRVATGDYDGIVFTSRSAARIFCRRYAIPKKYKIISIGPRTSRELRNHGYAADYEAVPPDSDVLAAVWDRDVAGRFKLKKVLYPCSNLSDNKLLRLPDVEAKAVYETAAKKQPRLDLSEFSGVVFTSSSTVDGFIRIYKKIPSHLVCHVYGGHTAANLAARGYKKNVQTLPPE